MVMKPGDVKADWSTVWSYFERLEKGRTLKMWEWSDLWWALRNCEEAQKDRAIETYIIMSLKARKRRFERKEIPSGT